MGKCGRLGPYLCRILRHEPGSVGLTPDRWGYVPVDELIRAVNAEGKYQLTRELLEQLVMEDEKQRYGFSDEAHTRIRCRQGHSFPVDLGLEPKEPPEVLYHGTPVFFKDRIFEEGIRKMKRQYVHLSGDMPTAMKVAGRRGRPFIFRVQAGRMFREGHEFFLSENGVWLTDYVPAEYIEPYYPGTED